ncbi:MAG: HAD family hydrolase [Deltaproteobacteria bacterium]|nr:HAD family hydrolase [Deltaproteobacteria bacterium]
MVSTVAEEPPWTHEASGSACLHCGSALEDTPGPYCCVGCRVVHGLLKSRGLLRFYDLRQASGVPAVLPSAARDRTWLEPLVASLRGASGPQRLSLDLQGLQCAACVWLQDELFRGREGALGLTVNPSLGRVELVCAPTFDLESWARDVESFGYLLGRASNREKRASDALLGRLGVCAALALNGMLFGLPLYLGLREGPVFQFFRAVEFLCAVGSVSVGGTVFFKSAWEGLRRGILHLDAPIALGIALAFTGSSVALFSGHAEGGYFDTVAVFIALMLTGRWLQVRVLERNRCLLLASDGAEGLRARRVRAERVELVPCAELAAGDTLVLAPGELCPTDATLLSPNGSFSLEWSNGESAPRAYSEGETVPAGAIQLGLQAVMVRTQTIFRDSPLPTLLSAPADGGPDAELARQGSAWQRLARWYVLGVLVVSSAGFLGWLLVTGDLQRALAVTTAVLVVTCPCAFGLATPMAYELVQAGLRRQGLFLRAAGALDRLLGVKTVVFDKTGTLTTGSPELTRPEALEGLSEEARTCLWNLAVRSAHPKSVAVRRALEPAGLAFFPEASVRELPGLGVELVRDGVRWRLGKGSWALDGSADGAAVVFSREGEGLASLDTEEPLRPAAARELQALRDDGYDVWILSGDSPERVDEVARKVGVPEDHCVGGASPEAKARWLEAHDRRDTLMLGDGINDSLAVSRAWCSGTPAIDRPFLPARTDFFFISAGLRPVRAALRAARSLHRVHRRNLAVALAYNAGTVGISLAGGMSPVLCAAVMPLTSLSLLLATWWSLGPGGRAWRS